MITFLGVAVCSSVQEFENMLGCFRLDSKPKHISEAGPPGRQEEPWMITEEDLERNNAKVSNTQKHKK